MSYREFVDSREGFDSVEYEAWLDSVNEQDDDDHVLSAVGDEEEDGQEYSAFQYEDDNFDSYDGLDYDFGYEG